MTRDGVASLTARTLTEGVAGVDGAALAMRLERLGTSISADAEWDSTVVQMTATADRFESAFAMLAEVVKGSPYASGQSDLDALQALVTGQASRDGYRAELASLLERYRGLR